jgi:hypothetical protein
VRCPGVPAQVPGLTPDVVDYVTAHPSNAFDYIALQVGGLLLLTPSCRASVEAVLSAC